MHLLNYGCVYLSVSESYYHISQFLQIFDAVEATLVASIAEGSHREPSLFGFVVRLRGLPFSSIAEDVLKFCHPVILLGASSGVLFSCAQDGKFTGEVYVEVETEEDLEICLQKNKQVLGSRYIESIRSTKGELFHIAHHRGFFTLVAGVKKYYGLNLSEQHSGEVDFAGKLPRMRIPKPPYLDNRNLKQAFTGLGFSHHSPYIHHQHMQQHYHAGAAGSFTQLNYPIGAMTQQHVMNVGISQHHNPPGWPATLRSAFSPPVTGLGQQQHLWDNRLTTHFVVHPYMMATTPQTTTWGPPPPPPATATCVAMPQQNHHQQLQQLHAAGAPARYGGTQAAMSRQYPGFQGYARDGRSHYPMQMQHQQQYLLPSPHSNYLKFEIVGIYDKN